MNSWLSSPIHPPTDDPLAITQAPALLHLQIPPFLMPISPNPIKFTYFSNQPQVLFQVFPNSLSHLVFLAQALHLAAWLKYLNCKCDSAPALPKNPKVAPFTPHFKVQFFGMPPWSLVICPCLSIWLDPPKAAICTLYFMPKPGGPNHVGTCTHIPHATLRQAFLPASLATFTERATLIL